MVDMQINSSNLPYPVYWTLPNSTSPNIIGPYVAMPEWGKGLNLSPRYIGNLVQKSKHGLIVQESAMLCLWDLRFSDEVEIPGMGYRSKGVVSAGGSVLDEEITEMTLGLDSIVKKLKRDTFEEKSKVILLAPQDLREEIIRRYDSFLEQLTAVLSPDFKPLTRQKPASVDYFF